MKKSDPTNYISTPQLIMSSTIPVKVQPSAGFCIKSTILQPAIYAVNVCQDVDAGTQTPQPLSIPKGFKIFVNIAWDRNVPPPPEGSEEAIQLAMQGQDVDEYNPEGWFVPVVVSDGREDKDKGELHACSSIQFPALCSSTITAGCWTGN